MPSTKQTCLTLHPKMLQPDRLLRGSRLHDLPHGTTMSVLVHGLGGDANRPPAEAIPLVTNLPGRDKPVDQRDADPKFLRTKCFFIRPKTSETANRVHRTPSLFRNSGPEGQFLASLTQTAKAGSVR